MIRAITGLIAGVGLACFLIGAADDKKTPPAAGAPSGEAMPPEMQAMMEAWAKYAAPGDHHAHMKPLEGKWKLEVKSRFDPDAPMSTSESEVTFEWILGGRFLVQKVSGDMMGDRFEGLGILGYDNYKQKYTAIWMDSMSTCTLSSEGTCDAAGKTITFVGEYDDPMTGSRKKSKTVYQIEGPDRYMMEMFDHDASGKEYVNLQILGTRVKEKSAP